MALAADDVADVEQVWHEITAVARFLRDCGRHGHARSAIRKAQELLDRMGLSAAYRHRLETLELQIRQAAMYRKRGRRRELEALLQDAVRNGAAV